MKRKFIQCVVAVFLGLALCVSAEEPAQGRGVPEEVLAHISMANPREFLGELFGYVGEATKGTVNHVPAEVLSMLANAYLPVPFDAWDGESEMHLILVQNRLREDPRPVVLFAVDSFEQLLDGLREADWDVSGPELVDNDPTFVRGIWPVRVPGGPDAFVTYFDDGRALFAEDIDAAKLVVGAKDWEIAHDSDADILARVRVDGEIREHIERFSGQIQTEIADNAGDIVRDVAKAGMTEAAGRWLAKAGADYGRLLANEIEQIEEFSIEIDIEDEQFVMGYAARSADGSWTRKWAETMEAAEQPFPSGKLPGLLPEGYFTCGASANIVELVPDIRAIAERILSDLALELAPDRGDELLGHNRAFFAARPGGTVSASYLAGRGMRTVAVSEFADAQAALDAMTGTSETMNAMLAQAFADPADAVGFPAEKLSEGGREWIEWRIEPADAERFEAFRAEINRGEPDNPLNVFLDPDFRFYAARLENPEAVVTATGVLGREEFAAILTEIAGAADGAVSPFDAPEAQETQDAMGAAQLSLVLFRTEEIYRLFVTQHALLSRETLPPTLFDNMERTAGTDVLYGLGAEDGRVIARMGVPARAVSAAIRMYERHMRMEREAEREAWMELEQQEDEEDESEE